MRMGQQRKIQVRGTDRQLLIFKQVLTLLHTAVNYAFFVAYFYKGTASGYLVSRAEKGYFHTACLPVMYFYIW